MHQASLVVLEQLLNRCTAPPYSSVQVVSTSASGPHQSTSTRRIHDPVIAQQVINPRDPFTLFGQPAVRLQVIGNLAAHMADIIPEGLVQFLSTFGVKDADCHRGFLPCGEYARLCSETRSDRGKGKFRGIR